jgi:hypothetical protein
MRTACPLALKFVAVAAAGALVLLAPSAPARGSDPARKAKVALALAGPSDPCPERAARVAVALAPAAKPSCDCEATGKCGCAAGTCSCCADGLPPLADQEKRARAANLPLVAYYGGATGRCCDGAYCGAADKPPAGLVGPVIVYAPVPGGMAAVAQLPASAKAADVRAAVEKAAGMCQPCKDGRCPAPIKK